MAGILSINSAVSYGYVGNAVQVPALQRLGHDAWRLDTVAFSNHPGHGGFSGVPRPAAELAVLLDGLDRLGVLAGCAGVLSGYLGLVDTALVAEDAVRRVKAAVPGALYCCDPVLGDGGRLYVRDGVPEAVRDRLLPLADIITPNAFELEWLAGRPLATADASVEAARGLAAGWALTVEVTGRVEGTEIASYAIEGEAVWRVAARWRDRAFNGTGDLFAALFLGWRLRGAATAEALGRAVAGLDAVTAATEAAGRRELALVESLDAMRDVSPATVERPTVL